MIKSGLHDEDRINDLFICVIQDNILIRVFGPRNPNTFPIKG